MNQNKEYLLRNLNGWALGDFEVSELGYTICLNK